MSDEITVNAVNRLRAESLACDKCKQKDNTIDELVEVLEQIKTTEESYDNESEVLSGIYLKCEEFIKKHKTNKGEV